MIGEWQDILAFNIFDGEGIGDQVLAPHRNAGDGHRAGGRVIDRVHGQGCRGGRGTEFNAIGDAEGEGRLAVDIGRWGIDQIRNIRNGNHLGRGYRRAAQRQAAVRAGGQAIDAHLLQGIAAVGIGKTKLGGRKSMAVILVQRGRQPA